MTILTVQPQVTKSATFTGTPVDVSGITGDWTLKCEVNGLTANANARLLISDNKGGSKTAGPSFHFFGALSPTTPKAKSVKKADWPGLAFGSAGNTLTADIVQIDGASTVSYHIWLEY